MAYQITRGKIQTAKKVVIYGPEGIGKSTFVSRFPDPLFCDVEGSTKELDVARLPTPTSWMMLLEQVRWLIANPHQCKTYVLDTADWAERMCIEHVCSSNSQKSIESFGYGKGYTYVYEEFGRLLNLLSELVNKSVNVAVTAHAQIRKFEQPDEMGSYDRYELKLTKKTGAEISAMLKEWCDMLLFANYKTFVINVDGQGATKGKNKAQGGERVMYTTHKPSWDAKNRYGLPEELPFDYAQIAAILEGGLQPKITMQVQPPLGQPQTTPPIITAMPSQETQTVPADPPQPIQSTQTPPPKGVPQALWDLMQKDGVTEPELMFTVAASGYYPNETPIQNYEPEFVQGCLIGAWPQVYAKVLVNREAVPF